jgi:phosphatidylserine/phosphatidylglycerophosphate/cardiolipin synthase-like enzyme
MKKIKETTTFKNSFVFLFVICCSCSTKTVKPEEVVEFKNPPSIIYKDVKEIHFTPSLECEDLIIKNIKKYKNIDIAIYSINNDNIIKALKEARDKNKNIRIVVDNTQSKTKNSKYNEIKDYGIELKQSKKHKIEHNKFIVLNKVNVITGSFNYTNVASKKNSENCLLIFDREQKYSKRFEELWDMYAENKSNTKIKNKRKKNIAL